MTQETTVVSAWTREELELEVCQLEMLGWDREYPVLTSNVDTNGWRYQQRLVRTVEAR